MSARGMGSWPMTSRNGTRTTSPYSCARHGRSSHEPLPPARPYDGIERALGCEALRSRRVFDLFLGRLMTLDDFDLRLIATEVRRRGSRGVPAEGTLDGAPFAMTFRYTDVWVPFAGSREAAGPDRGPSHAVAR